MPSGEWGRGGTRHKIHHLSLSLGKIISGGGSRILNLPQYHLLLPCDRTCSLLMFSCRIFHLAASQSQLVRSRQKIIYMLLYLQQCHLSFIISPSCFSPISKNQHWLLIASKLGSSLVGGRGGHLHSSLGNKSKWQFTDLTSNQSHFMSCEYCKLS